LKLCTKSKNYSNAVQRKYKPRGGGGGFALVILGLALGDSRVGGIGAVLGLGVKSSVS